MEEIIELLLSDDVEINDNIPIRPTGNVVSAFNCRPRRCSKKVEFMLTFVTNHQLLVGECVHYLQGLNMVQHTVINEL